MSNSITHTLHLQTKEKFEKQILSKKHVFAIGLGEKRKKGSYTKEPAIVVFVKKKVPLDILHASDHIPDQLDGLLTDVVCEQELKEIGILPQEEASVNVKEHFDAPLIEMNKEGVGTSPVTFPDKNPYSPMIPGCVISVYSSPETIDQGTMGPFCLNTTTGKKGFLTAKHVVENRINQDVTQANRVVASVQSNNSNIDAVFCPMKPGVTDYAAGSNLRQLGPKKQPQATKIVGTYHIVLSDIINDGYPIWKRGVTTGFTIGFVRYIHVTKRSSRDIEGLMLVSKSITYIDVPTNKFFAQEGDSGAGVYDTKMRCVGMLISHSSIDKISDKVSQIYRIGSSSYKLYDQDTYSGYLAILASQNKPGFFDVKLVVTIASSSKSMFLATYIPNPSGSKVYKGAVITVPPSKSDDNPIVYYTVPSKANITLYKYNLTTQTSSKFSIFYPTGSEGPSTTYTFSQDPQCGMCYDNFSNKIYVSALSVSTDTGKAYLNVFQISLGTQLETTKTYIQPFNLDLSKNMVYSVQCALSQSYGHVPGKYTLKRTQLNVFVGFEQTGGQQPYNQGILRYYFNIVGDTGKGVITTPILRSAGFKNFQVSTLFDKASRTVYPIIAYNNPGTSSIELYKPTYGYYPIYENSFSSGVEHVSPNLLYGLTSTPFDSEIPILFTCIANYNGGMPYYSSTNGGKSFSEISVTPALQPRGYGADMVNFLDHNVFVCVSDTLMTTKMDYKGNPYFDFNDTKEQVLANTSPVIAAIDYDDTINKKNYRNVYVFFKSNSGSHSILSIQSSSGNAGTWTNSQDTGILSQNNFAATGYKEYIFLAYFDPKGKLCIARKKDCRAFAIFETGFPGNDVAITTFNDMICIIYTETSQSGTVVRSFILEDLSMYAGPPTNTNITYDISKKMGSRQTIGTNFIDSNRRIQATAHDSKIYFAYVIPGTDLIGFRVSDDGVTWQRNTSTNLQVKSNTNPVVRNCSSYVMDDDSSFNLYFVDYINDASNVGTVVSNITNTIQTNFSDVGNVINECHMIGKIEEELDISVIIRT